MNLTSIPRFLSDKILPYPNILRILIGFAAIFSALQAYFTKYNNFIIFKQSFAHLVQHQSLYIEYPKEYWDYYLYGPSFSVVAGIFQLLPDVAGMLLWNLLCAGLVVHAVSLLKLAPKQESLMLLITFPEIMGCMTHIQTNPVLLALIIYAFVFFEKGQVFWAAAFILLGFHIKIFALAAGAFMFLYPKKIPAFMGSAAFWFVAIGAIPLLFIPTKELIWQYQEWANVLLADLDMQQEISFTGLLNVTFGQHDWLNASAQGLAALATCITFAQPTLRQHTNLRYLCLASILIWVVIFNHAAESPTYVIAIAGIALWFVLQPPEKEMIVWISFAIMVVLSMVSPTDFFPRYIREHIVEPYSLKALGPCLIWFYLMWELWARQGKYRIEMNLPQSF